MRWPAIALQVLWSAIHETLFCSAKLMYHFIQAPAKTFVSYFLMSRCIQVFSSVVPLTACLHPQSQRARHGTAPSRRPPASPRLINFATAFMQGLRWQRKIDSEVGMDSDSFKLPQKFSIQSGCLTWARTEREVGQDKWTVETGPQSGRSLVVCRKRPVLFVISVTEQHTAHTVNYLARTR